MKKIEIQQPDTEEVKALWDGGQNFPWPDQGVKPPAKPVNTQTQPKDLNVAVVTT